MKLEYSKIFFQFVAICSLCFSSYIHSTTNPVAAALYLIAAILLAKD